MTSITNGCAIPMFPLRIISIVFVIVCWVIPVHADQSQSFVWVGDAQGADNSKQINTTVLNPIVDSILALSTKPKVVIFGGDMAHRGGTTNITEFKTLFTDRLAAAGIPSASTVGNHDLYTQSDTPNNEALKRQQEYQILFNSTWTQNGPSADYKNLAFSFNLGNSLFIIADSVYATENGSYPPYGINTVQQNWIKDLLKSNTASHSFFFTHVPAFSPWVPSANGDMKDTWKTITTSGNATNTNVSMMFAGHEHLYYRTLHDGAYEVLAGSAGAPLNCQTGQCGPVYQGDVYDLYYNYAIVSINGREVTVRVLDQYNRFIDGFQYFDNSGVSNQTILNTSTIAPDPSENQPTGILAASYNTITNSASISNVFTGIDAVNNNTITNSGSISPTPGGNGIHVYDNNTITNDAEGKITGNSDITTGFWGIRVNTGNTVDNNGTVIVSGTNSIAFLAQGDNNTLTNTGALSASGTDSYAAKFMGTGNALVNSGTISGNLWFDAGDNTLTNNGTIDGSGGLYKAGSGTLTLRGPTSHTGGTHLSGGVVNITQDASLGALSGGMFFDGGTLQLSADVTSARNVILNAGGGTFDTNGYGSTLSGNISGSGSFTKVGAGTVTLRGANTYGGGTTVNGGLFLVNNTSGSGTGTGSVTVGNNGSLGGAGTIGGKLINTGTVSPGSSSSSIGTLTVNSSYSQNNPGTLQVKVASPTSNDLLKVGGSANINGTLETLWQGGSIPVHETVFGTILSAAAGVSGKFANLKGNRITPTLYLMPQYDRANEVYLMADRDYGASDLVSILTENQRAIANMLSPLANSASGDLDTVLGKIDALTTDAQVAAAFDQLAPIAGMAQTNMTSGVASFQNSNVTSRLGDLRAGVQGFSFQGLENLDLLYANSSRKPFLLASNSDDLQGMIPVAPDPNWGFFVRGNLVLGDQKDTAGQRGYDFRNGGLTLGTDYRFSENFVGGALFGMNTAKSWINDAGSTVKLDGYTLGFYGTYFRKSFYLDGQASYGWNNFDNNRRIVFPGIDRTATASPSGGQATAYGGTGYDFSFGSWTIGPALTFQYLWMSINGYAESGADSLNLQVDRQTTESYQGSAGVKGAWNWTKDKLRVVPRLWGFYRHEFGNVNPATIASLAQGSSAFTIESVAPERNFFSIGAGLNVHWTDRVLAYLNYEAQLGQSAYSAQSITLGLRLQF
ncbi:MAG: autotransporter domain-containing protein [Syntrophales bacterium]|nr:autotransporter domain-containing protein [Syntrophales bacterium]